MKGFLLPLIAFTGLISACQNNSVTNKKADSVVNAEKAGVTVSEQECYSYTKEKDTISLSLNKTGDQLTGDMTYNLFEKDRNYGTITGKMKGDTLLLDYIFDSEGMHSARQEVFLKKNNQLMEGYGDMEEKSGKMIFKDLKTVKFSNSIVLNKTECD